jgi:DNA polymerase-4
VTLKVKHADFTQITRSKTVPAALPEIGDLEDVVGLLLALTFPPGKGSRLIGVSLSSLERRAPTAEPQLRPAFLDSQHCLNGRG